MAPLRPIGPTGRYHHAGRGFPFVEQEAEDRSSLHVAIRMRLAGICGRRDVAEQDVSGKGRFGIQSQRELRLSSVAHRSQEIRIRLLFGQSLQK
jgi:hypothetical protein